MPFPPAGVATMVGGARAGVWVDSLDCSSGRTTPFFWIETPVFVVRDALAQGTAGRNAPGYRVRTVGINDSLATPGP